MPAFLFASRLCILYMTVKFFIMKGDIVYG